LIAPRLLGNGETTMDKIVLDTSFLSALVNDKDTHHTSAKKQYAAILERPSVWLIVSVITLLELSRITWATPPERAGILSTIISKIASEIIYLDQNQMDYIEQLVSLDTNLKPNDFCIALTALRQRAELLTFDEKLIKGFAKLRHFQ